MRRLGFKTASHPSDPKKTFEKRFKGIKQGKMSRMKTIGRQFKPLQRNANEDTARKCIPSSKVKG
jgi:hypothetical protein